jgi:secreted PhoX family phosphatase
VFFHSTSGGNAGLGQVWKYHPTGTSTGELTLIFESPSVDALDSPDNLTVSPRGGLLICEDGATGNFLRGLTSKGEIFPFAQNVFNDREFAGACFSPNGKFLFVNIQGGATAASTVPSFTFAIWGPWEKGAL